MQVQNINGYSYRQKTSFGSLSLAPEVSHLLPQGLRSQAEDLTKGLMVTISGKQYKLGRYSLDCNIFSHESENNKGILGALCAVGNAFKRICFEHAHMDCSQNAKLVFSTNPRQKLANFVYKIDGKNVSIPTNENPILLLIKDTIEQFKRPVVV